MFLDYKDKNSKKVLKMKHFILYLVFCSSIYSLVNSIHVTSKDHSLDYYQFPTGTKNIGIYHDTDIEDAEDDEDYNNEERSSFRDDNKLNLVESGGKLRIDQKTSLHNDHNLQGYVQNNLEPSEHNIEQANVEQPNSTNSHTSSVIPTNSTTISNASLTTFINKQHLNTTSSTGSKNSTEQLIVGLHLYKGLTNITKQTGQHIELRCIFRCIKNAAGEKCETVKQSNLKWYKNEAPLKNQKNKIEITFVRRKNDYKDIVSKLNIYKLDTHDKGFYKCELRYNRQNVDSVGVLQINDQEDTSDDTTKIETAIRANFDGLDGIDGSSLNSNHYESSLTNLDVFQKPENNKLFSTGLHSIDYLTTGINNDKEQCIHYRDEICSQYLPNQTVIIQSPDKHRVLIKRLHNLVTLINEFKTLSFHCLRFVMMALCQYTYPLCEKHQETIIRKRMMCREDCETLEHSICKTEYELAKLQNLMNDGDGILPECSKLPIAGSKEAENCVRLETLPNMVSSTIIEEESCYHDNGRLYRGKVATTINGEKCLAWSNQHLISIAEHPELYGGHNYCRNPDGKHRSPYCIVNDGLNSWRREICDLKECGNGLAFLIISPVLIACVLFSLVLCSCCTHKWLYKNRKSKKNKKCIVPAIESTIRSTATSYSTMQAAQQRLLASLNNSSVNLFPNTLTSQQANDLNIISMNKFGMPYLPSSSNIELNSLLANSNEYHPDSCYQLENRNIFNNLNLLKQNPKNLSNKKLINKNQSATILKHYPLDSIQFFEELGQGAFGDVFKGELTLENEVLDHTSNKLITTQTVLPIAIKTLREDANSQFKIDFKHEAELMADLQHPNIVALIGVCFDSHPMCMFFEFMNQGDLQNWLRRNRENRALNHSPMTAAFMPISSTNSNYSNNYQNQNSNSTNSVSNFSSSISILELKDFLHISTQIAAGMDYLSSHHYVHRDLAARNCLVSDHLTVKIADFGLSRDIYSQDYYRVQSRSLLPVRWMPAEAILYGRFSTESDIWSFGILLWEVFSYGMQPYYGKTNQEVIDEVVHKRSLLDRPENCPTNIYNLMLECWSEQPCKRPNFNEIHSRLRNLKAVYSNSVVTASSTCNNLSASGYEVFDQADQLPAIKNDLNRIQKYDQVVNSNSCGNLLHQNSSDTSGSSADKSPCINKFSIFKQSKTIDKNLDSEQYQQPLTFNHYKNCNNNLVNSTGNLNARNNLSKLTKNFSFSNNIQKHLKNINSSYKDTFRSSSSFKLDKQKT